MGFFIFAIDMLCASVVGDLVLGIWSNESVKQMSKADVYIPAEILSIPVLFNEVFELLYAEFERMWPEECAGGDPTFIYHASESKTATKVIDDRAPHVVFWGKLDPRENYITGYLRGLCEMMQKKIETMSDARCGSFQNTSDERDLCDREESGDGPRCREGQCLLHEPEAPQVPSGFEACTYEEALDCRDDGKRLCMDEATGRITTSNSGVQGIIWLRLKKRGPRPSYVFRDARED